METASAPRRSTRVSSFDPCSTLPAAGKAPSKAADDAIEEEVVGLGAVQEEEKEANWIKASKKP
jgi:hypothetical protein